MLPTRKVQSLGRNPMWVCQISELYSHSLEQIPSLFVNGDIPQMDDILAQTDTACMRAYRDAELGRHKEHAQNLAYSRETA